MSINSFFDAIFCINLDSRPDRWQLCLAELAAHDITGVERVPGVPTPENGYIGNTESHRDLLRRVAAGPHERVLVLEDDFQVVTAEVLQRCGVCNNPDVMRSFNRVQGTLQERFDQMIPHVPSNWDVLFLGAGYGSNPLSRVHPYVIRCGRMLTTASYGITRAFAKVWTAAVDAQFGDTYPGPIDNLIGNYAYDHFYYVFHPRLMIQRQGFSDITKVSSDYIDSMCNPLHENTV